MKRNGEEERTLKLKKLTLSLFLKWFLIQIFENKHQYSRWLITKKMTFFCQNMYPMHIQYEEDSNHFSNSREIFYASLIELHFPKKGDNSNIMILNISFWSIRLMQ